MADNIAELKAWISANFQKFDQIAGWVKSNFFIRGNYQQTSAGTPSAGLPIILASDGKVDASFIDDADIDHGSIGGLSDDDHAQYLLLAGRTGGQTVTGLSTGAATAFTRNLTAASTDSPVVSILQDHASDDQAALLVAQDGQGSAMEVRAPNAKSSATVSTPLTMYSNDSAASALALLYQINGNAVAASRYTSIHSVEQGTGYRALVLNPNADVLAVILRAFSAAGLTITDDGGNTAIFVEDGGQVGIGKASADSLLDVDGAAGSGPFLTVQGNSSSSNPGIDIKKASHATLRINTDGFAADTPSIYTVGAFDMIFGVNSSAAVTIKNGGNVGVGVTPTTRLGVQAGTSTNDAAVGGLLYVDSATRANGTTVETDLSSYSVPANTLSTNNMSLVFEAWVTITNNANTKTIKLYFGATSVTLPSISGAASTLYLRGHIVRTGAATQDIFYTVGLTSASPTHVFTTSAETLSGAVTLKLTGQSSAASNDVKQEMFKVWFEPENT